MCSSIFLVSFKWANITFVFKVGSRNQKNDYRPISSVPVKFDTAQQMKFSISLVNITKCFSIHHCLQLMIKKWKKAVDNEKVFGALLTDLSKAFDNINPTQKYN